MWELDHKEGWSLKNWCFQTVVLEKTLEHPLDCKEIKPVNPKRNQPWIFIGRTGVEVEALILWPRDAKSWLIGKTLMLGKIEGRRERVKQDEMVGWHHWLNGHEFEQALGDGEGQGILVWCSPWGCKKSDMTEPLNNNKIYFKVYPAFPLFIHSKIMSLYLFSAIIHTKYCGYRLRIIIPCPW